MTNTQHAAIVAGVFLMVGAATFGTYWVASRGTEAKPAVVATAAAEAPAAPPAVGPAPANLEVIHADVYFDFKTARLSADAVRLLLEEADRIGAEAGGLEVEVDVGVDDLEVGGRRTHGGRCRRRLGRRGRDHGRLRFRAPGRDPVGPEGRGADHQEQSCNDRCVLCVGHGWFLLGGGSRATRGPGRPDRWERMVSRAWARDVLGAVRGRPASPHASLHTRV